MDLSSHSLTTGDSGADESQQSQSLFDSGSELATDSMELFSQPSTSYSFSSTSQHSQTYSTENMNTQTGAQNTQDDGRGAQNMQRPDSLSEKHPPQSLGGPNKYYTRYLKSVSVSKLRPETCAVISTPLAGEKKHGDTGYSKEAFETWKSKQQERLEKKQLIEEVVKSSLDHVTKELNQTIENAKKEIKEVIKEQLVDFCSQQKAEIDSLQMKISTLERAHTTTLQSTLSNEMTKLKETLLTPFLQEFKVQMSQFSEHMKHTQADSSDEDVQCVEQSRASPVDGQRSVAVECSDKDRSVDDWLDFQPTKHTSETKSTSQGRIRRRSKALLLMKDKMSSALEDSNSEIGELFASEPSVFSPDSSDEDVQCVEQSRTLPVDGQRSVTLECNKKERSVDMLDDWLDFQPTKHTPDTRSTSQGRIRRSSEAARRQLLVREQMCSALEGSDSVLRELFLSAPSP